MPARIQLRRKRTQMRVMKEGRPDMLVSTGKCYQVKRKG
ncbi:hypothetical protein A2U01_0073717 [Trifolium medium]|uniref:Uncharacterized protein n=1 Tax=Trifolium medium TaxID=97028 RepID=A0A392SUG3_9FABA|nr:hypothetical protein [Trifolium medium]